MSDAEVCSKSYSYVFGPNWSCKSHLEAGDVLSKLFLALDQIYYRRLWPRYMADMHEMKTKHPATRKNLKMETSVTKI